MKQTISGALAQLPKHKRLLWLLIGMGVFAIGAAIYIGITVTQSELRIITHYTAFGSTHFYRDQWTYMIAFIVFIIVTAILGVSIALKLLRQDRETLALLYGWVSIGLIAMTLVTYIHLTRFI